MAPFRRKPSPSFAIMHIMYKLHTAKALEHEDKSFTSQARLLVHIIQRTARIFGTCGMRMIMRHPLGWSISEEVLVMLMYGILQSRKVSVWRAFFSGVGELMAFVPAERQLVVTGSCSSWWIRLPEDEKPRNPRARINWLFVHGGAFVAGDAVMYTGTFYYWMRQLAKLGVDAAILSVEYPLAPEHPFPCALHSIAGAIEWLIRDSGEGREFIVGGDSAGGNLAIAATALLRDEGRLTELPVALTLISPAVDISDTSVFAEQESVSSHIDKEKPAGAAPTTAAAAAAAAAAATGDSNGCCSSSSPAASPGSSETRVAGAPAAEVVTNGSGSGSAKTVDGHTATAGLKQQQQQHPAHPHSHHHPHPSDSRPGGTTGVSELLRLLAADVRETWATQRSSEAAAAAAARGWFDYLPGPSMVEELHHYMHDPSLLTYPLVSPTYMKDFSGLSKQGMFITAGGAELMRPDIKAFADKVEATGVPVLYHEEPNEPHCWAVLALPPLLKKSKVLLEYVERVSCETVCLSNAWRVASDD